MLSNVRIISIKNVCLLFAKFVLYITKNIFNILDSSWYISALIAESITFFDNPNNFAYIILFGVIIY
jgi:hypothetical protein